MTDFDESEELTDDPDNLIEASDMEEAPTMRNPANVLEPDMADIWPKIRQVLTDHKGQSLTVKALARRMNFDSIQSITLRRAVKKLLKMGKIVMVVAKRSPCPHDLARWSLSGF